MWHLILKDIRANKKQFMTSCCFYLPWLAIMFQFFEGTIFMYQGFLLLTAFVFTIFGMEKRRLVEILTNSLPVKRSHIVLARYLVSFLFVGAGILVFSLFALILNCLLPGAKTTLLQLHNPGNIFTYTFTFTLVISYMFPFIFRLGFAKGGGIGLLITALFFYIIPVTKNDSLLNGIDAMTRLAGYSNSPGFYPLINLAIVILITISIMISTAIYKKVDL